MAKRIAAVEPGGIAEELGLREGDVIEEINGEPVLDSIDYQALIYESKIVMKTSREEYEFEKDEYEPLGLQLEADGIRNCVNNCLFCFVEQLPCNVRDTMRVKDDDWRQSLIMGNFVTLTNVHEKELERIIRRGASPLYISVHATEPELRKKLLGCENAGNIMEVLRKLQKGGISYHLQAVLCPGINDGEALERTIEDLYSLVPEALSLALVPVGLTKFRDELTPLRGFNKEEAKAVLDIAARWRRKSLKEHGTRFVFPSDEFYLLAGEEVPFDTEYEDYAQIDNGIGLLRMLETEFSFAYEDMRLKKKKPAKVVIATGVSAQPFLEKLMRDHPVGNVKVSVKAIRNTFFGETVTVAGLITGGDLVNQLKGVKADAILITCCMLRAGEDVFLDDMTLDEATRQLGIPIIPVERSGDALLDTLIEISEG